MARVYYDADADLTRIQARRIAVIGYGSQGHAHAENLRDSGCDVRVGLYHGSKSWARAEADGFVVGTVSEVSAWADLIAILLPDQLHKRVFEDSIRPQLRAGTLVLLAHGFSVHFDQIQPPAEVDVAMVAPKSPGHMLRRMYVEGIGVPALFAVYEDASGEAEEVTLGYARALGCTKAGVLRTTFKEETETDLFGEQAVLCGGTSSLVKAGFETLVEAGYQPELAYFEVLHELKLIVDLMYQGGLSYMRYSISETAEYGDYVSGPRIVDARTKDTMRQVLTEIQDGTFARKWIAECDAGGPEFAQLRERDRNSQLETVGRELRSMMTWLQPVEAEALPQSETETSLAGAAHSSS